MTNASQVWWATARSGEVGHAVVRSGRLRFGAARYGWAGEGPRPQPFGVDR